MQKTVRPFVQSLQMFMHLLLEDHFGMPITRLQVAVVEGGGGLETDFLHSYAIANSQNRPCCQS